MAIHVVRNRGGRRTGLEEVKGQQCRRGVLQTCHSANGLRDRDIRPLAPSEAQLAWMEYDGKQRVEKIKCQITRKHRPVKSDVVPGERVLLLVMLAELVRVVVSVL